MCFRHGWRRSDSSREPSHSSCSSSLCSCTPLSSRPQVHHSLRPFPRVRSRCALPLFLLISFRVARSTDYAPLGYLFIVQRGLMVFQGKVLTKGKVWGEDVVLQSEQLKSPAQARAMNYVAAYYISRTELLMVANRYPATAKKIRRFAIWLAFMREVVSLARLKKQHEEKSKGQGGGRLLETLLEVYEFKLQLSAVGSDIAVLENMQEKKKDDVTEGGRLAGYANDVGVQFEIVNTRINELQEELKQQAEVAAAMHQKQVEAAAKQAESMERMRSEMMQVLCSRLGVTPGSSPERKQQETPNGTWRLFAGTPAKDNLSA